MSKRDLAIKTAAWAMLLATTTIASAIFIGVVAPGLLTTAQSLWWGAGIAALSCFIAYMERKATDGQE